MGYTSVKELDHGIYQDAKREGLGLSAYLEHLSRQGEFDESFVRQDARNSKGAPVDAFKQILAKAGIRTKGELAQTGEAFFTDPSNRVLFPEFVAREYRDAERDLRNLVTLSDLVQTRVGIDGVDYRAGVIEAGQEEELEFGRVAEGAEVPVYTVKLAGRAIRVYKYGGSLKMTYEAIRRVRLPVLSRYIAKIARAQGRRKLKAALSVALNGDGNGNPAANTAAAGGAWTLADLRAFQMEFLASDGEPQVVVGDIAEVSAILGLVDPTAGNAATPQATAYRDAGTWPTIYGMSFRVAPAGSILEDSRKILGVDTINGLEEVHENGSEITESERLITTQFEQLVMTENIGYAKPDATGFRTKTRAAA